MSDVRHINACLCVLRMIHKKRVPIDSKPAWSIIEHTMNNSAKLAELRHSLARYGLPPDRAPIATGHPQADAGLGGGLRPGSLHEIFAQGWCAGGFATLLALLAAAHSSKEKSKSFFWVRPDYEAMEYGACSPN